jgi:hypothetical protein
MPDSIGSVGNIMQASDGKLYGTFNNLPNNGAFSFDPITDSFRVLKRFDWGFCGVLQTGFYEHTDGNLYIVTSIGNTLHSFFNNLWGNIYSYSIASDSFTIVAQLSDTTGYSPLSPLSAIGNGLLGGSCSMGGTHKAGTIFTFNPQTKVVTPIFNFDSATTGQYSSGGVTATQPVGIATGITAVALKSVLNIYPNPAGEQIFVENTEEGKILYLYNALGEVVNTYKAKARKTALDISGLAAGTYFINDVKFIKN